MRTYVVSFSAVSMAAIQDLFTILAADDKPVTLLEFGLFADAETAMKQCRVTLKRIASGFTIGSAGSAPTPAPWGNSIIPAAGLTARTNDTTVLTGTAAATMPFAWNALNGLYWLPAPEERPSIIQGEAMLIKAETTFGSTVVIDGYVVLGEGPF